MSMEPVAWMRRDNFVERLSVGADRPKNATSNPDEWEPLYPASAIQALQERVEELIRDYDNAYNRGLIDGNRLSIEQQQAIHAAEARATEAEQRLEKAIEEGLGMDLDCGWRHVARAVIAECDRKIEAAKPKGTIADIVAAKLAKEV